MNIIILNDYAKINGGAAKVAIDSAIGLAKQGHRVIFFTAVGPIDPGLIKSGVKIIYLQQHDILNDPNRLRAAIQGLWNIVAAKQMADLLRQYSPENTIIHVHGWTKALSSSPIRVALQRGFKVVLTLHDYFIACPNGGFFDYQANTICQRHALSFSCITHNCDVRNYQEKIWRIIRQIIQKYIGKIPSKISGFIAVSNLSFKILREYIPSNSMIKVIPNPIEVKRVEPVDVSLNKEIVYIGRLSKEKGVELFAEAIKKLDYQGVIVGDGPLINILRIQFPYIQFTGWLPNIEVQKILQKARILVFPSLWYETQGIVVLEAMSFGIPVIISDTSIARDIVTDGITGLWFKGGDVIDLENKINILLNNNELAKKIGFAAYNKFWENPFITQRYIDFLNEFYIQILMNK
jgi:glycosyltransferase involved in cell wall biosynthesis